MEFDPNTALDEIWELHAEGGPQDFERLLELIIGMDTHIRNGGDLPLDWFKGYTQSRIVYRVATDPGIGEAKTVVSEIEMQDGQVIRVTNIPPPLDIRDRVVFIKASLEDQRLHDLDKGVTGCVRALTFQNGVWEAKVRTDDPDLQPDFNEWYNAVMLMKVVEGE